MLRANTLCRLRNPATSRRNKRRKRTSRRSSARSQHTDYCEEIMKLAQRLLIASTVFVGIAAIIVKAQNLPPNFGTPQGTNALAASAGFIDILGIKLGMPAEQALATLKANYPSSKISLARTADYESAWYNVERENPSHKWVFKIDVDPNGPGDKISVGLSLPPSTQVVHAVGRESFLKEPVAVENIVAGLRKKY